MPLLHLRRVNQQTVLVALALGFGTVLVLLIFAGAVAVREVTEMQQRTTSFQEQQQVLDHSRDLAVDSILVIGLCLLVAVVSAVGTIWFVKHCLRRLSQHQDELNRVSWQMLQTQEQTARRFSHELHDELGQVLAAIRSNVQQHGDAELRMDMLTLVDSAIANVRELSQLLRPVILDDFGLQAGLSWLMDGFGRRARKEVRTEIVLEARLHQETETHLFRIAQEALTNVARHSRATLVTLRFEELAGQAVMSIRDNGQGMAQSLEGQPASLGLVGMKARARECGGELELANCLPHGLCIIVKVPMKLAEVDTEDA